MIVPRFFPVAAMGLLVSACTIESTTFVNDNVTHRRIDIPAQPPAPAPLPGTVDENGDCVGGKGTGRVAVGASECDVVAALGKPDDILIGSSSSAARETQFLYQTPDGKKLYFFANGKMTRTVGGAG